MRLRQIALVARDLRPVEDSICETFGLEVCYRDPGLAHFGLRHGLYPIGDHILEVVVPKQPGTSAERFLERRGSDALDRLVGPTLRERLVDRPSPWRRWSRIGLLGMSGFAMIVALMQPQWGLLDDGVCVDLPNK